MTADTVVVGIFSAPVWTIPSRHVDELRRAFPDIQFLEAHSHKALETLIADADVAFSSMIREKSFANARQLRWIHSSAAGVGATLFPALIGSDVVVTNSRGVQAPAIAEHIVSTVLAWRRRLHIAMRRQQAGVWAQDELATPFAAPLAETRALIVGMGSIGGQTARMLRALGMQVDGVGRSAREGQSSVDRLPELLPSSDIVIITAPHTPETDRLFDGHMLARMKPDALLVNVGRGRIIDEAALTAALEKGSLGGAALDVFDGEPLASDSPLWAMENVIITPHVAGFGPRYWEGLIDLFGRNLERWRRGEPLENVVDKRRGY
ncbi:MAG: D-2-hydroxyacid dehydrogenase [Acidobacteriota bacterium]|nr:D-2-hydroxyacid dehydrogenase [Acidobacteriota bacterium]